MRNLTHKITNLQLQQQLNQLCDDWLDGMDDPILLAQAAGWLLDVMQSDVVPNVSTHRVKAVRLLRSQGFTLAEIAAELGITRARVEKIANA